MRWHDNRSHYALLISLIKYIFCCEANAGAEPEYWRGESEVSPEEICINKEMRNYIKKWCELQ